VTGEQAPPSAAGSRRYAAPQGGLPPQSALVHGRAVHQAAYVLIPGDVLRDIVTSALPFWEETRAWILARPMSGLAETFAQYAMEVAPGGGSDRPEPDPAAEGVLFLLEGDARLTIEERGYSLTPGGYAYLPPGCTWRIRNEGAVPLRFQWIRKAYEPVPGLGLPDPIVTNERDVRPEPMPGTDGAWTTTHFVDPADLRHDMHVTIVTFAPGAVLPFAETHVMEHGLYVLEGKAVCRLNQDWVEVRAGDFMLLRAFCPQACYAGGPGPFRYLLYKDVNRHPRLAPPRPAAFGQPGP
jgi:(S)-ureidoglycine aminohydrolase